MQESLKIKGTSFTVELIERSKLEYSCFAKKIKAHNLDDCKWRTAELALGFAREAYLRFSAKLCQVYDVLLAFIFLGPGSLV